MKRPPDLAGGPIEQVLLDIGAVPNGALGF
jgi:hypothetical protein